MEKINHIFKFHIFFHFFQVVIKDDIYWGKTGAPWQTAYASKTSVSSVTWSWYLKPDHR